MQGNRFWTRIQTTTQYNDLHPHQGEAQNGLEHHLVDCVVRSPNSCEGLGAVEELRREGRQVPCARLLLAVVERVNDRRHLGSEGVIMGARPHLGGGAQVVPCDAENSVRPREIQSEMSNS